MNLIELWQIKVKNIKLKINLLMCIDPVSSPVELIQIDNQTAAHVSTKFQQCWLARYP